MSNPFLRRTRLMTLETILPSPLGEIVGIHEQGIGADRQQMVQTIGSGLLEMNLGEFLEVLLDDPPQALL